jgi:para-aminobenzoate synthetase component 1
MEKHVIKCLAGLGFEAETAKIIPDDLLAADSVIMTNSLVGAVPVLSFDSRKVHQDIDLCRRVREFIWNPRIPSHRDSEP